MVAPVFCGTTLGVKKGKPWMTQTYFHVNSGPYVDEQPAGTKM